LIRYLAYILFFTLVACDYIKKTQEPEAVARVGDEFLFRSDLQNLVPNGASKEDSIAIVKSFIDRWATQKLLFEAAEINLNKTKVDELDQLIQQYKVDLLTNAYLEELIIRKVDTVVSNDEITQYYEANKQFFKNPNELVKLRYINLVKENPKFEKIRAKFNSFTPKDKKELAEMAIQFKSYAFNDSIWVDVNQVYQKLPFINADNKEKYISNGISYQYPDSTTVWLVKVKQVLPKDNPTPLQFLRPTIKQVIINKRKVELIKTIENEITNDAFKNNKYEIYK
jgi:cupin superfamily acireductone dioxygenase involved in methionine salvage